MTMIKSVLSSALVLGVVLSATAANAEAIRSGAATPGVVSLNKSKLMRMSAPKNDESKVILEKGSTLWIAAMAAIATGVGGYFILDNGNIDSPGA